MSNFFYGKSEQEIAEQIRRADLIKTTLCNNIIYDPEENPTKIWLCKFWLEVCYRIRKMGFLGPEWKISLYDCFGEGRDYNITSQADLTHFNYASKNINHVAVKPKGLWFSNFFELISGQPKNSWISWCLSEMPEWIDPSKCKFIIVARFDKSKLFDLTHQRIDGDQLPMINWGHIASRYAGVNAGWGPHDEDFPRPERVSGDWDVPSWVAWDHRAFEQVRLIRFQDLKMW